MVIPIARKILPEELLTTYISDLAEMNGCTDREFTKYYLKYSIKHGTGMNEVPANLEEFCSKNEIIPSVYKLLMEHTELLARLPLMPYDRQAQEIEVRLRHPDDYVCVNRRMVHTREINVCPVCARENNIILAPHQVPGVRCCYKHGVLFSAQRNHVLEADINEMRIAQFAYSMYTKPIFCDYASTVTACITRISEFDELEFELDGELWTKDSLLRAFFQRKYRFATEGDLMRIAAMLFRNSDDLRVYMDIDPLEKLFMSNSGNLFAKSSRFGPLMEMTCSTCNTSFFIHPFALYAGLGCPTCRRHRAVKDNLDDIVKALLPGYVVTKNRGVRIQLQNEDTKNTINGSISSIIWTMVINRFEKSRTIDIITDGDSKNSEKECSTIILNTADKRVGLTNIAKNGQSMTIIAYRGNRDIDVRFDDGTVVQHTRYDNFRHGVIKNPAFTNVHQSSKRMAEKYVGASNFTKHGEKIIIVEYRNVYDIDVRFEDGVIAEHRSITEFKTGAIRKPKQ